MTNFNFNNFNQSKDTYQSPFKRSVTPKWKPFIITTILAILVLAVIIYVVHPPFNWHSQAFIFYLILIGAFLLVEFTTANLCSLINTKIYKGFTKFLTIFAILAFVVIFVSTILTSQMFNAKEYYNRIQVEDVEFNEIDEVDFTKTPIIDRNSTIALGDRVMGQMPELVSQFEVSTDYTQISYKDSVYRVTPLEYADVLKYFLNRDEGIPAYITVDSTTGEAELVKLKDLGLDGMKYVPSALFNENLQRKLQLDYPTKIFGAPSFEIDEDGHPWYVCTTYTFKAMGTKRMVDGVVLFDPITGDSTYFDDPLKAPEWVDRIYPESLVMEEVTNHGSLKDGYINSVFGQKNVYLPSDGYNYLEKDGDIWIYSGLTSANSDAANLGFILVNLRTHEAMQIASAGADEYSAMNSAEGNVKNFGYRATFPLLVNVKDRPVYLMALKDDAGLIKMYAMVDATDYQKVASVTIDEGLEALKMQFLKGDIGSINNDELKTASIEIAEVRYLVVENNTKVFIKDTEGKEYKISINNKNEDKVAFLNVGDKLNISYLEASINNIVEIK